MPTEDRSDGPGKKPTDPETGQDAPVGDARQRFAELTSRTPRDLTVERAFLLSKIETVKRDPLLSEEEKAAAIAALQGLMESDKEAPQDN
jgi:hypothetical protein